MRRYRKTLAENDGFLPVCGCSIELAELKPLIIQHAPQPDCSGICAEMVFGVRTIGPSPSDYKMAAS